MMRKDQHTHHRLLDLVHAERRGDRDTIQRVLEELVDTERDAAILLMLLARTAGSVQHLAHHLMDVDVMPRPNLTTQESPELVAAVQLIAALANDDMELAWDLTQAQLNIGQDHAMQVILTLLAFAAQQHQDQSQTAGHNDSPAVPLFGTN
jgi:hypothetical protein